MENPTHSKLLEELPSSSGGSSQSPETDFRITVRERITEEESVGGGEEKNNDDAALLDRTYSLEEW